MFHALYCKDNMSTPLIDGFIPSTKYSTYPEKGLKNHLEYHIVLRISLKALGTDVFTLETNSTTV